ncbi:hypothetical protein E2C01_089599 [Portunus trituberculatus]|uniref:Uncharacterized protein n=1 Tax=Portunus trituberculatus TaxID=210409 RepID=A0A5B7J982_PORTR|nr:hypothetical protein [Portunus trituberculatus]
MDAIPPGYTLAHRSATAALLLRCPGLARQLLGESDGNSSPQLWFAVSSRPGPCWGTETTENSRHTEVEVERRACHLMKRFLPHYDYRIHSGAVNIPISRLER